MTMDTSFDDAEGMLQDQGLEVVVIPYRPSPPPRPPVSPKRYSPDENAVANRINLKDKDLVSPAGDESKVFDGDCFPPPPPPRQLTFTPRTQAAMAEATGQKIEITPPPHGKSWKTDINNKPPTERIDDKPGKSLSKIPGRAPLSQTVGASTDSSTNTKNNHTNAPKKKSTPPRFRSKSTPAKSSKQSKKDPNQKMGFYQMAKIGYQELCNAIIRPPRSDYSMEALGPEDFVFCGEKFIRKDFGVVNERGLLVECSMWKRANDEEEVIDGTMAHINGLVKSDNNENEDSNGCGQITLNVDDWDENKERGQMYLHVPESFEDESLNSFGEDYEGLNEIGKLEKDEGLSNSQQEETMSLRLQQSETAAHRYYQGSIKTRKRWRCPVVIYLHGNSSGRPEVIPQLGHLLSLGVSVVAFDFAGSGKSEGEYVSLGFYEQEDLQTVIHHLRASGDVSTIALWGRSMGAATAIMYGSRDPTISCMILDSSFTDLTRLAEEMVERGKEQGVNVPNFVVSVALRMIKSTVKSQAGFSIRHISPISHANRCFIPAMFIAGEHDDFINKRHSELLHDKYAGDKNLVVVDGDHNSPRPRFLLQSACLFLQSCMQLPPSLELVVPSGTNLLASPWICPMTFRKLGLDVAIEKARLEALSISGSHPDERKWLPIDDTTHPPQQRLPSDSKVSLDDISLKRADNPPPGLPLPEKGSIRSRSVPATSPTALDFLAASELPDMSARQKAIQASLFKMLGQNE